MSQSSFAAFNVIKRRNQKRLSPNDCGHIVTWLENPSNFNAYFGAGAKMKIDGNSRTKKAILADLAAYLKEKSNSNLDLTPTQMYHRLSYYKEKYVATKKWRESQPGAGITESDEKMAVHAIARKLAEMCPHFERMDVLFGHRPSVTPLSIHDSMTLNIVDIRGDRSEDLYGVSDNEDDSTDGTQPTTHAVSPAASPTLSPTTSFAASPVPIISPRTTGAKRRVSQKHLVSLEDVVFQSSPQINDRPLKRRYFNPFVSALGENLQHNLEWQKEKFSREITNAVRLKEIEVTAQKEMKKMEIESAKEEGKRKRKARILEQLLKDGRSVEEIKDVLNLIE